MKTYLTFGDIHGRSVWKDFVFGSTKKFDEWALKVYKGEIPEFSSAVVTRFCNVEKIIFVGDYLDSFTITNVEMKHNLSDLFLFKRTYEDRVIMLWGNHDVSYWLKKQMCEGFRPEMYNDFHELIRDNRRHMQFSFQVGNMIWTHAGLTKNFFEEIVSDMDAWFTVKYHNVDGASLNNESMLSEFMNDMWEAYNWKPLLSKGRARGGINTPGPLWADRKELVVDLLPGFRQFVGHTPIKEIATYGSGDTTACFVDCLEFGEYRAAAPVEVDEMNQYAGYARKMLGSDNAKVSFDFKNKK